MICTEGPVGVFVCREPATELSREADGDPRWCFRCRKVQVFHFVITGPTDPMSVYEPTPAIHCSVCNLYDGDLFPGRIRDWYGEFD